MDKYELVNQIGDGTFGSVAKAVLKRTGQLVAIKKMKQKFYTWEECVKLPEVDVVRRIHGHPNVVKLREVIRENNELFFVFEYMDGDLLGVIKKAKLNTSPGCGQSSPCIPYPQIRSFMHQMLQALAYIHKRGYFHRDLKPENLLIRREPSGEEVLKLADFGLVKEIRSRPPFTDYVSTRWYRAPELLLQDRFYSSPVDIWAAGCIMAELITTRPLFPGTNEVDQLFKIMSVLGAPTEKTWAGGIQLAKKIRYTFPTIVGTGLAEVLPPHTPAAAMDLLNQMLTYDPKLRPTAGQCLQHPFFTMTTTDDSSEPSAAALEQLASAAKRLRPGPQSSPPPLKGAALDLLSVQKVGCATADGSLPEGSPRKLCTLGRPTEGAPSLKPVASSSAVTFPGVSAKANGGAEEVEGVKGMVADVGTGPGSLPSIPSNHASATKRRSQDASGPTSTLAKKLAGLKNAHVGNGKAPGYGGSATRPAQSPRASVSPGAAPALSLSKVHTTGNGRGPGSPRDGKPLKMNAAQPLHRRISKGTEPSLPVNVVVPNHDVSLDDLMEELTSDLPHLSVSAERRESNAKVVIDRGSDEAPLARDSVAALLSSSRFKKTAAVAGGEPTSSLQPLKMNGTTRSSFLTKQRKSEDSSAATELPRVEHATKGVSPSLKALLAKHKTSAFAYQ
jgi:male germ cell-associated kinase